MRVTMRMSKYYPVCISLLLSNYELTTKFKYMHISGANLWKGNTLTDQIMRFWLKRREKLIHEYSLVGYILSPNPTIMAHAREHKTQNHDDAAETLINKLILDQNLVGNERRVAKAKLIDTFLTEYGDFINKRGCFARDHIWILASEPNLKSYRWHQKYMLPVTKVLGKLACLVLSKILGIGTAERNWKQVKAVKSGQQVNTTICKTTKQVLIYAQYQQARAQAKMYNRASAGKLWDDNDFASMKMDEYCKDLQESVDAEPTRVRHVRLWMESWETHANGPNEDVQLKERLERKYVGLKMYDRDDDNRLLTCTKAFFKKKRGDNTYCIFAVTEDYNPDKDDMDEDNYEHWTLWDTAEALYECIWEYYMANQGEDGVVLHEQNTGVDSDHEDEN